MREKYNQNPKLRAFMQKEVPLIAAAIEANLPLPNSVNIDCAKVAEFERLLKETVVYSSQRTKG